jgi:2-oxoisovalerate dehydrogenase E1 component alpha subunit
LFTTKSNFSEQTTHPVDLFTPDEMSGPGLIFVEVESVSTRPKLMPGLEQRSIFPRPATLSPDLLFSGDEFLTVEKCLLIHELMLRARLVEERSIRMMRTGESNFWVGGPGEEAFNTCLGLQVKKGQGPAYDYLHLHYRGTAMVLAMGMPPIDHFRQMAMTATDPHSRGRNFPCHYAVPEMNIVPTTSVVSTQYLMGPGTAMMQVRHGGDGVSIVTGGDAGAAQGDFTSCMTWSTRPEHELPVLMIITNNGVGISTPAESQSYGRLCDRGLPFDIPGEVVDGNDPIASWHGIRRALDYCRRERRPYLLEAKVSRLYGHSSSSGASRDASQNDPLAKFEKRLIDNGFMDESRITELRNRILAELDEASEQVRREPAPTANDVERFTYAPSPVDRIYPNDYTGLPR